MAPTPPTSPRTPTSPAKFKEHYSHLTYAVKRTKEDDDGTPSSKKGMSSSFQSREEANLVAALSLPPLKLISGFAISEDSFLMSRFVSPPRFGLNNLEQASDAVSPIRTSATTNNNNNNNISPSSERVFTATVSRDVHGNARISIPCTSNNIGQSAANKTSSKRNNNNNNNNNVRTLFFTTGYTPVVETNQNGEEVPGKSREEILLELADNDPWKLVLLANQEHGTGLGAEELGMLEWATFRNLVAQLNISFIIESPIHRARTELGWRKIHDRILLNEVQRNKVLSDQDDDQDESGDDGALSATVKSAILTGSKTTKSNKKKVHQQQQQPSIFSVTEKAQQALDFQNFVDHFYPPTPILQAAGGPIILVRTAPQGEILVNPTSAIANSPRRRKTGNSLLVSTSSATTTNSNKDVENYGEDEVDEVDLVDTDEPCVHYRKIPYPKNKNQFGKKVESSPLKRPALVKQIPKQF